LTVSGIVTSETLAGECVLLYNDMKDYCTVQLEFPAVFEKCFWKNYLIDITVAAESGVFIMQAFFNLA
jgi:hypothetical protein